jgi:UrcA family protein
MSKTMTIAALATMLAAYAQGALAEDGKQNQVHVRYGDLNLSTPDGVRALRRRIHWAAEVVCGRDEMMLDFNSRAQFLNCVNTAANQALEKVQVALAEVQYAVK